MNKRKLPQTEAHKRKISASNRGKHFDRRGKKLPEETRRKMSEYHKKLVGEKNNRWGTRHSEETKKRMSEVAMGRKFSNATRQKLSEWNVNHPNRVFKDTSIELKVEAELQKRGINYQKQVPLCNVAIVDFYLPEYRIVIECDGDYWHSREKTKIKDEEKTKVLTFNGFNVYRFWERDINKSVESCIDKLFKKI